MCRVFLLACCLTVSAIAAPVPKGSIAAPKPKGVEEEEKKAARYKALRESYESLRDSLPRGAERSGLEADMNLAREVAQMLFDLEKIADPKMKALHKETWEKSLKKEVARTPRLKELFEIYSYELGPLAAVAPDPKVVEEKRAEYYKALRKSYDSQRAMYPKGPGLFSLIADMDVAREVAQERLDIEKTAHPILKTFRLEKWEAGSKREVTGTPRRKELFELYSYELSQKK